MADMGAKASFTLNVLISKYLKFQPQPNTSNTYQYMLHSVWDFPLYHLILKFI